MSALAARIGVTRQALRPGGSDGSGQGQGPWLRCSGSGKRPRREGTMESAATGPLRCRDFSGIFDRCGKEVGRSIPERHLP